MTLLGCHKPGCMEESQKGQVSITGGGQHAGCCSGAQASVGGLISPFSLSHLLSRTEIVGLWRSSHPERAFIQAHPLLYRPRQDRSVSHSDGHLHSSPCSAGTWQCWKCCHGGSFPFTCCSIPASQPGPSSLLGSIPAIFTVLGPQALLAGWEIPSLLHAQGIGAWLWVRPLSSSCKQQIPTESLELVQSN